MRYPMLHQILASEEDDALNEDYELTSPDAEISKLADHAKAKLAATLRCWTPADIQIRFASLGGDLGKYRSETESHPIMMLDAAALRDGAKDNDLDLETVVESTVYHELGHALVELLQANDVVLEYEDEEELVEAFAHMFWENGTVLPEFKRALGI